MYSCSKISFQKNQREFPSKQPRLASIASSSQKSQLTVDAILGKNESQKSDKMYANIWEIF